MLPTIPHDKANHACYGAALSLVGALIAYAQLTPTVCVIGRNSSNRQL